MIKIYGIIYEAINKINGKKYIGQTIHSLSIRRSGHFSKAKTDKNIVFYQAINKYGKENFEWEIIDSADSLEELDYKEIYWIKFFNTYGQDGYNMTLGGQSDKKITPNDGNVENINMNNDLVEKY
jgi:group I intron endonuclease